MDPVVFFLGERQIALDSTIGGLWFLEGGNVCMGPQHGAR
jgi:hypothetical protein